MLAHAQPLFPHTTLSRAVRAGDGGQFEVLHGSLLQLYIAVSDLTVTAQHLLDGGFGLREQINELYIGRQEKSTRGHRTQVELRVQEVKLNQWTTENEGVKEKGISALLQSIT